MYSVIRTIFGGLAMYDNYRSASLMSISSVCSGQQDATFIFDLAQ